MCLILTYKLQIFKEFIIVYNRYVHLLKYKFIFNLRQPHFLPDKKYISLKVFDLLKGEKLIYIRVVFLLLTFLEIKIS